jgi:hypothetical protein
LGPPERDAVSGLAATAVLAGVRPCRATPVRGSGAAVSAGGPAAAHGSAPASTGPHAASHAQRRRLVGRERAVTRPHHELDLGGRVARDHPAEDARRRVDRGACGRVDQRIRDRVPGVRVVGVGVVGVRGSHGRARARRRGEHGRSLLRRRKHEEPAGDSARALVRRELGLAGVGGVVHHPARGSPADEDRGGAAAIEVHGVDEPEVHRPAGERRERHPRRGRASPVDPDEGDPAVGGDPGEGPRVRTDEARGGDPLRRVVRVVDVRGRSRDEPWTAAVGLGDLGPVRGDRDQLDAWLGVARQAESGTRDSVRAEQLSVVLEERDGDAAAREVAPVDGRDRPRTIGDLAHRLAALRPQRLDRDRRVRRVDEQLVHDLRATGEVGVAFRPPDDTLVGLALRPGVADPARSQYECPLLGGPAEAIDDHDRHAGRHLGLGDRVAARETSGERASLQRGPDDDVDVYVDGPVVPFDPRRELPRGRDLDREDALPARLVEIRRAVVAVDLPRCVHRRAGEGERVLREERRVVERRGRRRCERERGSEERG